MTLFDELWRTFLIGITRRAAPFIPPNRPHRPSLTFLRQKDSPTMALVFALKLDPTPAGIVKRTLGVTVNGTALVPVAAVDGMELTFAPSDVVILTLTDTNEAGIDSAPSDPFTFTASALVPPAKPATPSVTFLREIPDAPPAEPTPETPQP